MLPLHGLTVVALEQAVAAPFCTSRLADAGARVIKVERPEGDFARGYDTAAGGLSSYFVWLNRGKESVVVDLATEAGRERLRDMIAGADVFVQNLKPGALDRLGLSVERLRGDHQRLICCSITGYGDRGPLADRKAYDLLVQAESGLASLTGNGPDMARVGFSVVDVATGATAHAAILEALIERGRSGRGADLRVAMFDVMADWLTVPLLQHEDGKTPQRLGLRHPSIAPYGAFRSRDDHDVLIAIQNDREWRRFAGGLLAAGVAADQRFATNNARVSRRAEVDAAVAAAFAQRERSELTEWLTRADIAFAEVNDMAALSRHPHLRRIAVQTGAGEIRYPAPAAVVTGSTRRYGPVPDLGP